MRGIEYSLRKCWRRTEARPIRSEQSRVLEMNPVWQSTARSRVARNLQRLRTKRGLTQGELALKAGSERTYVSRLEQGRKNPTLELLERLAKALKVDVVELLAPISRRRI